MDPKAEKRATRPRVSLKEKWEAVKRMEEGDNSLAIAKELGVSQRVIYQWISVKDKIKKWYETSPEHAVGVKRKNLSQVYNQQLDEVVYLWYVECVKQGIPATGPMIRLKAMELNEQLGAGWPFQASDGWLSKWKKRRGIIINPEQRFADEEPITVFADKFKTFIEQENLTADQVFICSEAFLCYKLLPSKHFGLESGLKSEFRLDRLSIVTCCNATGIVKLPLIVIGRTEVDQKNLSLKMQSISYKSQKLAWLDNDIFRDWFLDEFVPTVSSFLEKKSLPQKAVLILDDHTVLLDENIFQAGEIKTMYLPPKVTRLVCMEEGVLENIKKRYRYQFLTSLYFAIEDGTTIAEYINNITMNEVLHWLATSWNEITPFTISNLWKNVWTEMKDNNSIMTCSEADPPPNSEFLSILHRMPEFANIDNNDLQDWLNSDRIMPCIPDEELIMEVQKMFSDTRDERRKAADLGYNEEVPKKRGRRRKEDPNHCSASESVDGINFLDGFGNQTENASNDRSSLPVDVNCDLNVMSPASSMNDSTIEQPKEKRKRALSFSKESEKTYLNESIEINDQKLKSDEANEVDAFCKRLAASMRRLPTKIRSRVEIDVLKLVYEAEFGEKV